MIVAERKPMEELLQMTDPFGKILLVGCKGCVTVCNAGGQKEVGILASGLRIARKKEKREIQIDEMTLERQCDPEYIAQLEQGLWRSNRHACAQHLFYGWRSRTRRLGRILSRLRNLHHS